jgi:tetratricopeptide (TPR) repeat protein
LLIEPENGPTHAWKGITLHNLKWYEEALAAREQALQYGYITKENYLGSGSALYELQRYEEAIAACEQAIQLDPAYADAYSMKTKAISQQRKKKIS